MMGPSNQMAPGAERPEHPAMSSRPPPHGTEISWNEETQQYEFPWGNVNANDYNFGDFEGLHDPHNHHPQNPEVPEDWMGGPLVPGYPYYD